MVTLEASFLQAMEDVSPEKRGKNDSSADDADDTDFQRIQRPPTKSTEHPISGRGLGAREIVPGFQICVISVICGLPLVTPDPASILSGRCEAELR